MTATTDPSNRTEIAGLLAEGPDPGLKEKLMLFGQFVGDWDIVDARWTLPDGKKVKGRGEIHFGWILNGRAVQDVWIGSAEDPPPGFPKGFRGTTIRFYDPKIDAWRSTWINPASGLVQAFIGRSIGEEIVLECTNEDGSSDRWIFSQIKPDSFSWRGLESRDHKRTWRLNEEYSVVRRKTANRKGQSSHP